MTLPLDSSGLANVCYSLLDADVGCAPTIFDTGATLFFLLDPTLKTDVGFIPRGHVLSLSATKSSTPFASITAGPQLSQNLIAVFRSFQSMINSTGPGQAQTLADAALNAYFTLSVTWSPKPQSVTLVTAG
jgi:hypothetical protein